MTEAAILRTVNEKMRGIWYDQFNNIWNFTPDNADAGVVLFDNINHKYKFTDAKLLKLDVEFVAIYKYTNFLSGCEIRLEKNKTDFVYLSRKKLDADIRSGY